MTYLNTEDLELVNAMVHERKPRITDEDGCIDFDYQEGEC